MRYFKNPETGVIHAYDIDGHQDDLIKAAGDAGWPEVDRPVDPGGGVSEAMMKIIELESTITSRRLREAILGTDGGWLSNVNQQIAALRKGSK
jgi:hypothetical protein